MQAQHPLTILMKSGWDLYVPHSVKHLKRNIERAHKLKRKLKKNIISSDFASRSGVFEHLRDHFAFARKPLSIEQDLIRALTQPGIPCTMEGFDQVAAQYGIEPRHPWSDKRLIEFYMRLPLSQKTRRGWTKFLLRKTMEPYLAPNVIWNSGKQHLGWQLRRSMLIENQNEIRSILISAKKELEEYVEPTTLQNFLNDYNSAADDTNLEGILTYLTTAMWLRRVRAQNALQK
jgi:asparagine synthase (glutamine-hydrolysing)